MSTLNVGTIVTTQGVKLPSLDTSNRPANPQEGLVIYNNSKKNIELWDSSTWTSFGGVSIVSATGGTTTTVNGYRIHTFIGNETFAVTSGGFVDFLIVAGGGGGGAHHGGGGGAGGVIQGVFKVSSGSYPVIIGSGGTGSPGNTSGSNPNGTNGANSSLFGYTAIGGGFGGSYGPGRPGNNGGSGGGPNNWPVGSNYAGEPVTNQGNWGAWHPQSTNIGGGGGGAGAPGGYDQGNSFRNGGIGILSSISGTNTYYGGGGGAGSYPGYGNEGAPGTGGLGGGGIGGNGPHSGGTFPGNGSPNTGGGGGGVADLYKNGGTGGSGIVIIRYLA